MKKLRDGSLYEKPRFSVDDPNQTIYWLITRRLKDHPNRTAVRVNNSLGTGWKRVSLAEYIELVRRGARGLIGMGLKPGDTICILGSTSYEWALLDAAAMSIGVVVVPIYETSSAEQIEWMLEDTGAKMVFTDSTAHAELVNSVRRGQENPQVFTSQQARTRLDQEALKIGTAELDERIGAVRAEDLATIVYTSGTTGKPKGVEITHGNFARAALSIEQAEPDLVFEEGANLLLFLPLAHIMARIINYTALTTGVQLGYVPNIKNLLADLATFRPSILLVVPRVLEKVYNAAEAKAGAGLRRKIFRWAANVAVKDATKRFRGPWHRLQRGVANKLVLSKLREAVGGRVRWAVSAGAPLGTRLGRFYRGAGITVIEAWGLTETTGAATATRPPNPALGTVGIPMAGTTVKLDKDGEVLVKGAIVFRGYHNNPEATAEALRDGWYHTGDIGTIDKKGNLTITGRKKHLIVTAGGKNVAPAVLEDRLVSHPLISQVVVVGDQKPFISALITLDEQMLPAWLKSHGEPEMTPAQARECPAVLASLQRAIERTNRQVSRAESIRKFKIIPDDFTLENGMLTPSLKVKREVVLERYAGVIEDIYTHDDRPKAEK
ncbi:AMP-dependent synthetase/ligase [Actinobaculum suis]|uniref:AMP-dependent synthetase/ligase n=1 Tax=Actinobaculum suis TaxID=1657 RepID=UPI00066FBAF0|nr:AMP-dependent synthetase/ligase [Actinobaculum suis]KMY23519.1 long-chain fatty acid--CoA ligase [Actinobaculum suis]OCA96093.1 long-chain fatty acid--CoA ligase [Actinobaculum suis]OCA96202.1 long-chain fatty acid--CoA ligase [Actinobaculum suis]